jgi:hypothetical protein
LLDCANLVATIEHRTNKIVGLSEWIYGLKNIDRKH